MSFASPWLLALGAAALVPLLLHLLRRRIGTRVAFPAARYVARAEREHSRTLKLRHLLLLVARMAAVLLVALAAARPMASWLGGGHGPTALAVVVDNSLSTTVVEQGSPLFAHLTALAGRVFTRATPADRLWLVTADGVSRTGPATDLRRAVRSLSAIGGAGDPALALARANAAVRGADLAARQVVLLTDAQRTSWTSVPGTGDTPIIAWIPGRAAPANRAVAYAAAEPERWTPVGAIRARISAGDSTTYRILLDGQTLARGTAARGEEIFVRAAPPSHGWLAGSVELDPDELPGDNVRYFAAWVGPAPRVGVAADAGPFVANAVDVLRVDGRVAAGEGVSIVPGDELARLPALIAAPDDPVRLGAANRALARAGVPWKFGPVRLGAAAIAGPGLVGVQAARRYALEPTTGAPADTLARAGTEPWIVAGPGYVLVASPLAPGATDLPVTASFVPWLADVLAERLSGDPGRVVSASPMQIVSWPSWADALDGAPAMPGGTFAAPANPGTYFFTRNGRRAGALVVNPEPRESDLAAWSASDFARLLGPRARVFTDDDAFTRALFDVSARRPLVVPALALLALVLLAEGVLSARQGAADA